MARSLTEQDVKDALYVTSPCGPAELHQFLYQRWGAFDETSLKAALGRLLDKGDVSVVHINSFVPGGINLWCLKGQKVG